MGRTGGAETHQQILTAARLHVATQGIPSLTLEAVAREVGVTKQAVLYHFGSKRGLVLALYLDELEQEATVLSASVAGARSAAEAVEAFVSAAVDHYLEDLDRFRLLYVVHQMAREEVVVVEEELRERIYPATTRIYDPLEAAIRADPTTSDEVDPRRSAVGIHFAALGIATYVAMLDAAGDTLRHDPRAVAADLARVLGRGLAR